MTLAASFEPRVVRRLTWLLFFGQSLNSAAFFATGTVATLVGAHLSGKAALAGVPFAIHSLGAAAAAYPASRLMERWGRRPGLVLGLALGVVGAVAAGVAVKMGSFAGFLAGFGLMGLTRGFSDLGRFAAAEMHPAAARGRAISLFVLGGTIGAIGGPALVAPAGRVAAQLRADPLSGVWFAGAALFLVGLLLLEAFLRPDPRDIGRVVAAPAAGQAPAGPRRPWRVILAQFPTQVAISAMILGQLVMVLLMSITSLHMQQHGHGLGAISWVTAAHAVGMFGLSLVSGRLADRHGRPTAIIVGGVLLLAAALLAPLSQQVAALAGALFLLGLGWNFCYVAGAAQLTDSLTLAERGRVQGVNDLAIALVSALGSFESGALFASIGYARLAGLGLVITLVPLGLALRQRWQGAQQVEPGLGD